MSSRRSHSVRVCVRAADPNACNLPGLRLAPCWARMPMPLTAGSAAWWSTGPKFGHEQALISEHMSIVIHVCKTKHLTPLKVHWALLLDTKTFLHLRSGEGKISDRDTIVILYGTCTLQLHLQCMYVHLPMSC